MSSLPSNCSVSLKAQHYHDVLSQKETLPLDWFEVDPENYMGAGGPPHRYLTAIRNDFELSMHGVGMSLGAIQAPSQEHLVQLKKLIDRYQPRHVSEHLSWSHWNNHYLNDLLPLPYTDESLHLICQHIDQVQTYLERPILIENPSVYVAFKHDTYSEAEFLSQICKRTGCSLLLDINNIIVSAHNTGFSSQTYLQHLPIEQIQQIHLAGHSVDTLSNGQTLRIDDHGSPVSDAVWQLFADILKLAQRPLPVLVEWDTHIPNFDTLLEEAHKAQSLMNNTLAAQDKTHEA